MMALMALLASKGMGGRSGAIGGLGGLLGGALGGRMAGGRLGGLLEQFQRSGRGDITDSWVCHGENRSIARHELGDTLGDDTVEALSRETGMPRNDLPSQLSDLLPGVVDKLTPHGLVPDEDERSRW